MTSSQRQWTARAVELGRRGFAAIRRRVVAGDVVDASNRDLRVRVERLEAMVLDLQDALYRHSQHEDERIHELQRKLQPRTMARAMSDDARQRGL